MEIRRKPLFEKIIVADIVFVGLLFGNLAFNWNLGRLVWIPLIVSLILEFLSKVYEVGERKADFDETMEILRELHEDGVDIDRYIE